VRILLVEDDRELAEIDGHGLGLIRQPSDLDGLTRTTAR
jgi:hypothetical protein